MADVMISADSTMQAHAVNLKKYLHNHGFTVFMRESESGDLFQEVVISNASTCKVFVPLINTAWCENNECKFEFNVALRTNLEEQEPQILPLLLEKISAFKKYPAVYGCLCNTKGITVKESELNHVAWQQVADFMKSKQNIVPTTVPSKWLLLSPAALSLPPKLTVVQTGDYTPRQMEYHPSITEYILFGSTDGDVIVMDQYTSKSIGNTNISHQANVLGLCWLNTEPLKFLAGSEKGPIFLVDMGKMAGAKNRKSGPRFPEFPSLTSLHVNCTDTQFVASGYPHDVAVFDVNTGKLQTTFKEIHYELINVTKFSNRNPHLFATSSLDKSVKLWDMRQPPHTPVYARQSERGNVMVVFSPDDKFLLSSAFDNEVRQYTVGDGQLHTKFEIPARNSHVNWTRSYYMNNGEFVIVGSTEESVVRVFNANTGQQFREIYMAPKAKYFVPYVQSLRGDPLIPYSFTALLSYPDVVPSQLVRVSMLYAPDP